MLTDIDSHLIHSSARAGLDCQRKYAEPFIDCVDLRIIREDSLTKLLTWTVQGLSPNLNKYKCYQFNQDLTCGTRTILPKRQRVLKAITYEAHFHCLNAIKTIQRFLMIGLVHQILQTFSGKSLT
jgi:hypothetical protein